MKMMDAMVTKPAPVSKMASTAGQTLWLCVDKEGDEERWVGGGTSVEVDGRAGLVEELGSVDPSVGRYHVFDVVSKGTFSLPFSDVLFCVGRLARLGQRNYYLLRKKYTGKLLS